MNATRQSWGRGPICPTPRFGKTTAPTPEAGHTCLYGIGGSAIYRALLPLAHRLLVTEVDLTILDADAFFPAFDEGEWRVIHERRLREDGPGCVLREWVR